MQKKKCFFLGFVVLSAIVTSWRATDVPLPTSREPIRVYATEASDNLHAILLKGLSGAKQSIVMSIYALTDERIFNLLSSKAKSGVRVHLVVDKGGTPFVPANMTQLIRRKRGGLMHRKIVVVDEELVFIGSANFALASLKSHDNLMIGFHCRELAEHLVQATPSLNPQLPYRACSTFQIGQSQLELHLLPESTTGLSRLIEMIEGTKERLHIAQFTWTHPELTDAVIRAHDRGVMVTTVFDGTSAKKTSRVTLNRLRKAHISTQVKAPNHLMHHKLMVIDDEVLVTGSSNWTKAAFTRNDDCWIALSNLPNQELRKVLELVQTSRTSWSRGSPSSDPPVITDRLGRGANKAL